MCIESEWYVHPVRENMIVSKGTNGVVSSTAIRTLFNQKPASLPGIHVFRMRSLFHITSNKSGAAQWLARKGRICHQLPCFWRFIKEKVRKYCLLGNSCMI
jgi:hypothetical protein